VSKIKIDGRVQRSERSRKVIVDAMIALIEEGIYIPTAQQVADQAGISIRTVFRHFSEMEKLYAEIDEVLRPAYTQRFISTEKTGSLEERILALVETRVGAYVDILPLQKATAAILWRSEYFRQGYAANQLALRKDLLQWLPELKSAPATLEAVDSLTSFEFFDRLYSHQKLSSAAVIALINQAALKAF
jgi:AcrR family transcriptional regulator